MTTGDKVVCVDDSDQGDYSVKVVAGRTYIVAACLTGWHGRVSSITNRPVPCVDLVGLSPTSLRDGAELCYRISRFRKQSLLFAPEFSSILEPHFPAYVLPS